MATSPIVAAPAFGAALTVVQNIFGYIINEVESFPSIATTSPTAPFIPQNGDRLGLVLVNTAVNQMFVGLSPAVGSLDGIVLSPNGGAIAMNVRDDMTLTTRAWWALSITAPGILYVLEIIGVKAVGPGKGVGTA